MGTKEDVRARLNIAELIGEYVQLTPAGRGRLKGLCPFHKEKSPSFQVDVEQGYFYCFGCKAGGDAFSFVQRAENLSFGDALRKLAERVGVAVETRYGEKQSRDLYDVNAFALEYFREHLGGEGLAYLRRRGLTDETIERFELGFAPEGWDGLLKRARTRGVPERQLLEAGLLIENETGRVYDRFRNRVMFPIRDHLGRLVGFGGRVLGDEKPKYLNTPETDVFKKGELLYGLDKARGQVRDGGELVVVEGYMDVIAMQQAGFTTAVATLGTALTAEHATLLERQGVRRLALLFDRDEAGQKATLAGLDQVVGARLNVRALSVPNGKDPADAILAGEMDALRAALAGGLDEVAYRVQSAVEAYGVATSDGKRKVLMSLLPRMQNLDPLDEGASRMRDIACERLGIKPEALLDWISSKAKRKTLSKTQLAGMSTQRHDEDRELALLKQLLIDPTLLAKLDGHVPFHNETVRKVVLAARGTRRSEEVLEVFRGQPEEQLLIRLMFEARDAGAHSRSAAEQYEEKRTAYAAQATDEIQIALSIDQLRAEVDALKKQVLGAPPAEQLGLLRQISELQRAIEAEKRARKMHA
ncbi:DNA primase [Deinococcus maricopensis]|uniref:DNA primase n=1 Tax=Deinococcus maricopensis (strain DSM 21211 / LMG 22137 / NRRL B-23946 / LB-34) TaxID=709986 RepID=E8U6C5_DEIML|nr:DNA primase [Deinococcus maricopensis]ADV66614.1 DNA primase [Deinococcus maricopensis DSM 21211]